VRIFHGLKNYRSTTHSVPLKMGTQGSIQKRFQKASDSRLSGSYINSDHIQVLAGGFERLFGIMVRNKSGVVIKGHIALPAQPIKDDQQRSMFLVDTGLHKIDYGDVVPRLTSRTKSVTEHEPQRSFEHRFLGLLEARLLVKSQNFMSRCEFLIRAR
jgi:hypothetical protein